MIIKIIILLSFLLFSHQIGCPIGSYSIPKGTTVITDNEYNNCLELTDIIIPSSITIIGDSAFAYCSSLSSIFLTVGISILGQHMFGMGDGNGNAGETTLSTVTIPSTLKSIGNIFILLFDCSFIYFI